MAPNIKINLKINLQPYGRRKKPPKLVVIPGGGENKERKKGRDPAPLLTIPGVEGLFSREHDGAWFLCDGMLKKSRLATDEEALALEKEFKEHMRLQSVPPEQEN